MVPKTRKEAFKVLGLPESVNEQGIKKAYRKLALEPVKNLGKMR